jgi:hypothetical protein
MVAGSSREDAVEGGELARLYRVNVSSADTAMQPGRQSIIQLQHGTHHHDGGAHDTEDYALGVSSQNPLGTDGQQALRLRSTLDREGCAASSLSTLKAIRQVKAVGDDRRHTHNEGHHRDGTDRYDSEGAIPRHNGKQASAAGDLHAPHEIGVHVHVGRSDHDSSLGARGGGEWSGSDPSGFDSSPSNRRDRGRKRATQSRSKSFKDSSFVGDGTDIVAQRDKPPDIFALHKKFAKKVRVRLQKSGVKAKDTVSLFQLCSIHLARFLRS